MSEVEWARTAVILIHFSWGLLSRFFYLICEPPSFCFLIYLKVEEDRTQAERLVQVLLSVIRRASLSIRIIDRIILFIFLLLTS